MLDFLGIGAQKAGTTWIYEQLFRHPEIQFPAGKEVHFFDKNMDRGLEWYTTQFKGEESTHKGEITPAYAFLDTSAIRAIYDINPELKLIYSLRHPVERAWSGAMMALRRAEMTADEASDQWFYDHFSSQGSLKRGNYAACLNNWLSVFPEDAFCIICFDDIATNPRDVMIRIAEHLGVDSCFYEEVSDDILGQKVYANHANYPRRPKLQKKLEKLYAPLLKEGTQHPVLNHIYQRFVTQK